MSIDTVTFGREPAFRALVSHALAEVVGVLRELLPDARIDHVGSTAVSGSVTKGDLDVCVAVPSDHFAAADEWLATRFARNLGSDRTDDFSAFSGSVRGVDVGVQLVVQGSPSDTFVAWRDLLTSDDRIRAAYDDLKRSFEGRSMEAYRAAKAAFIRTHLRSEW